jgi:hypothetical protein
MIAVFQFGSLALPDGTYMIEPLSGLTDPDSRTRRKKGRKPHLLYKARSHAFHRYDDVTILRQNQTDSLQSANDHDHDAEDDDDDDSDWIDEDFRRECQRFFYSLCCSSVPLGTPAYGVGCSMSRGDPP